MNAEMECGNLVLRLRTSSWFLAKLRGTTDVQERLYLKQFPVRIYWSFLCRKQDSRWSKNFPLNDDERKVAEEGKFSVDPRGQFYHHFKCSFFASRFTLNLLAYSVKRTALKLGITSSCVLWWSWAKFCWWNCLHQTPCTSAFALCTIDFVK